MSPNADNFVPIFRFNIKFKKIELKVTKINLIELIHCRNLFHFFSKDNLIILVYTIFFILLKIKLEKTKFIYSKLE